MSQSPVLFDPLEYDRRVINGVPVYIKHIPGCPRIQIRIRIGVGARHDPKGKGGLAHFLEHMPLSGCKGWDTELSINRFNAAVLLDSLNASCSFESTVFRAATLPKNFNKAMPFLKSLVFYPLLRSRDHQKQTQVISREFWDKGIAKHSSGEFLQKMNALYGEHPLGRSLGVIGNPEGILRITLPDLFAFKDAFYHSGNLSVVIAGAISAETALPALLEFLDGIPSGPGIQRPQVQAEWSAPRHWISSIRNPDADNQAEQVALYAIASKEKNTELWSISARMIRELWRQKLRFALGEVYGVSGRHVEYSDHVLMNFSVKIRSQRAVFALVSLSKIILSIGRGKQRKMFLESRRMKRELLESMEYDSNGVASAAIADLDAHGDVLSAARRIRDCRNVTHKQVSNFVCCHFSGGWSPL